MIAIEIIPVQLKINSSGSVNTGRYFNQNDNGIGKLSFTVYREDNTEIDYSQISESYITLKFQDGTFMEPCACEVGIDSILYEVCSETLSKSGTVTGIIKLYSENGQVATSNIFRFVILADQLNGCTLADEAKVSLVNDLITKLANISFEEDEREASELQRATDEGIRKTNEQSRIESENTRGTSEANRIDSEALRVDAESVRNTEFIGIKEEYVSLVAVLKDSLNQMIIFDIPSFSNPPDLEIHRILFSAPTGYVCTITGITIISNGDSTGIDAVNTSQLQLIEGSDIISDTTFTDVEVFPAKNVTKELAIIDGLIDKDDDVYIKVINGDGVTTPNFSLQLNYDIEKIV